MRRWRQNILFSIIDNFYQQAESDNFDQRAGSDGVRVPGVICVLILSGTRKSLCGV